MGSLIDKMEASAATRLAVPAGHTAAQELGRFRDFLKLWTQRLRMLHRASDSGREVCRARAALVDILLRAMWTAARQSLSAQAQREFPPLALVALGGYGRGELSPFSDLDIMFLHEGQVVAHQTRPLPHLQKLMDGVLMPLWDLGFKVGHSVRSIGDCVDNANSAATPKSMETKTSLIEARLIAGSPSLFDKFQRTVVARCVEGHEDTYIAARVRDQSARHEKFGNSPTMQEPNLKNGCGGLRDYQNLHWMAFFKYRVRTLAEMQAKELISEAERKQLERACDFLLRVRNELHSHVGRAQDVLSRNLQPAVAAGLGYGERSLSKRVEAFMADFYQHTRNIYLITRTLEDRLALAPPASRLASLGRLIGSFTKPKEQLLDGFKLAGDQIHAATRRVFRDQPRRLMRVFLYAQQRGLRLHPDLVQLLRQELPLVQRAFLGDPHVRETFLEILNQRGNVARILRAMHEVGLLGKYLPEFGHLTCLVQHEFYHIYTADEHTLQCLEQLDRTWESQQPLYRNYAELFKAVERPFALYLAMLLHDAAKPLHSRDHAQAGVKLASRVARRLEVDAATTATLRFLVEQHLTMAQVSQRRDLEDPHVIRSFAGVVQSREHLRMLTLHTFADSLATSDKLWNGFKDHLLMQLYHKTERLLSGATEFMQAEARQRESLAQEVREHLPKSVKPEEMEAHFGALPARYFIIHSPREIASDLTLARRFLQLQEDEAENRLLQPAVAWHNEPDRGYTTAKVCTWDWPGLFSRITGSFSAVGINILSAQIFTRSDGLVLDSFLVADSHTGSLVRADDREKFEKILTQALTTSKLDLAALIARQKSGRILYLGLEDDRLPTTIRFDNESSEERTIIEIETEDRLGLLFAITRTMAELSLDISLAKISTEKDAAIDTFYVREIDGSKLQAAERQHAVEHALREAIRGLG